MTNPTLEPVNRADANSATTGSAREDAAETPRIRLQMPVDVRNLALAALAVMGGIFMLRWASAVFIPLMVGLLFNYALAPVVDWLQSHRIPRALSAAALILGILTGAAATVFSLSDDANNLIESLPLAAQKLGQSIQTGRGKTDSTLATVQKAATSLEQAAEEATPTPDSRGVQRVRVEKPKFDIRDHLWSGTLGLLSALGQIAMMALIAFFLLASGNTFRRKMVKLAGPTLSKKKVTLEALNEIHDQIQRYMLVQICTSALVGLATWLSFLAIGLENAAVWGIAAGVLNLVPYVGNVIITGGSALLGFMQFGTLEMAAALVPPRQLPGFDSFRSNRSWRTSGASTSAKFTVIVGGADAPHVSRVGARHQGPMQEGRRPILLQAVGRRS